jgi:hypothetical protein
MTTTHKSQDKNVESVEASGWWESAEEHRFALEVLQLPLRRKMLSFIAGGCVRGNEEIAKELSLGSAQAEYHLQMLEKALVIERAQSGWKATPTGLLYLKYVEARR